MAPSWMCVPSLLASSPENHFGGFTLQIQIQIQIHDPTFSSPWGWLAYIAPSSWAARGLNQCQAVPPPVTQPPVTQLFMI